MRQIKKLIFATLFLFSFFLYNNVEALTLTPTRFEILADPGETTTEEMKLTNETDKTVVFYSSFANFEAQGETGSPSFVEPKDGLGTWMSTDDVVNLAPGESKTIMLTIRVPNNASPGGNFATVFWGTQPPSVNKDQIAIGSKTGFLVLLTVSGEVSENGGVLEFATKENKRFFTSLPVPFYYRFQNSGGDRIKPDGDIKIRHMFGWVSSRVPANQVQGNILPNSTRRFEVNWKSNHGASEVRDGKMGFFEAVGYEWKNFGFGYYRANLKLTYGKDSLVSKDSFGFFVLPWQLLIILIIVGTILWYGIGKALRRYHNFVISKARLSLQAEMNKEGMR